MPRFLDTNVLLRYFTGNPPDRAERARQLLERVERGEEKVVISLMVVFETVFTLQRTYRVPRDRIRELVRDVLTLPGVQLVGKGLCLQELDLYAQRNLSFAEAYTAVYMQSRGLTETYSWDTDFDQLEGIAQVEP